MSKNKIQLTPDLDVDAILRGMAKKYETEELHTIDGVKIDFSDCWVHLRKSNTEPIIRVYAEAATHDDAMKLVETYRNELLALA